MTYLACGDWTVLRAAHGPKPLRRDGATFLAASQTMCSVHVGCLGAGRVAGFFMKNPIIFCAVPQSPILMPKNSVGRSRSPGLSHRRQARGGTDPRICAGRPRRPAKIIMVSDTILDLDAPTQLDAVDVSTGPACVETLAPNRGCADRVLRRPSYMASIANRRRARGVSVYLASPLVSARHWPAVSIIRVSPSK
jgi:hypothetical protein